MAAAALAPIVTHGTPPISVGSNEGKIPQHDLEWLKETPTDTPLAEMQRRLREDGYVFVKNLIPREDVLKVRSEYFSSYSPTGMLEPGTTAEDGIFNFKQSASAHGGIGARDLPANDMEVQTLIDAHKAPDYIDFVAHRDLRSFVRRLMGWDKEVLLQRTMLRHNVPGADTTAVHYDKLFLRGGEAFFLTAWVPIGDISQIGGGLVYLADSVALGKSIEDDFTARAVEMTPEERRSAFNVNMERGGMLSQNATEFADEHDRHWWLAANYEAGDVVFHDPYMIHTSSVNKDPTGKIRLSTDLRFYRQGDDMDKRWMKYWTPGDGL